MRKQKEQVCQREWRLPSPKAVCFCQDKAGATVGIEFERQGLVGLGGYLQGVGRRRLRGRAEHSLDQALW